MKINGESVFSAALTVTNEFAEARVLAFVATNSHSEFKSALEQARNNLHIYGHSGPEAWYTDNPRIDKHFMEGIYCWNVGGCASIGARQPWELGSVIRVGMTDAPPEDE
ncbi:hypothetical protein C8R44DRAFT_228585 [Mycena epipterygia]|nr:hypothetical protein C8R44DRAFT_228585 [Mycena epipterygia]